MAKNENLHKAKDAKKDEFYTAYEDIQAEVNHYEDKFKGREPAAPLVAPHIFSSAGHILKNRRFSKMSAVENI